MVGRIYKKMNRVIGLFVYKSSLRSLVSITTRIGVLLTICYLWLLSYLTLGFFDEGPFLGFYDYSGPEFQPVVPDYSNERWRQTLSRYSQEIFGFSEYRLLNWVAFLSVLGVAVFILWLGWDEVDRPK